MGMIDKSKSRLAKLDWINAATQILKTEGVEKVKVEPLARMLGVTRGSFYWHFDKRQDLLDSILANWHSSTTLDIIEALEQGQKSAKERLEQLINLAFSVHPESLAVEHAVRAWSLIDPKVKAAVVQVDSQRIEYLKKLILALGWSDEEAQQRACLVYYCRVGIYHQARIPELSERLRTVHSLLTLCMPAS